jgi:hypothetical protein
MDSGSAQRMNDLCAKVLSLPDDSQEFEPAVAELRAAIQQHINELRDQVATLALDIAAQSESKAAD